MTRATLKDVLRPAMAQGYAVPGFVCLGWEDARAYTQAAAEEGMPVILQAGPSCRAHTPLPVLGAMFGHLADSVSVPVVLPLDHGKSVEECEAAIEAGFTSVMYDGSDRPVDENIETTAQITRMAHDNGVSCEGEIGFVGYADGAASAATDPDEAARFARETGVDAMAVSIGNTHLQMSDGDGLDETALRAIEGTTDTPLVIHGGSGVPVIQRSKFARRSNICKFNIGTEIRMIFGQTLRQTLDNDPNMFDRVKILEPCEPALTDAARSILRSLGPNP